MVLSAKDNSYAEVARITHNFQNVIGKGRYGVVYQGHLSDGAKVAVKVISNSNIQGSRVFQTEASFSKELCYSDF